MVDGTVLGTTIVSLMVNGLCCAYQQKEEKENREAIRRDLRAEYWQQRLMDLEIEHRRGGASEERDEASPCSSVISEERRRKLLQDKQRVAGHEAPAMVVTPTSSAASSLQNTPVRRSTPPSVGLLAPNQVVKTTSLLDESDDDESDSEVGEARCRSNSLFDVDEESQEIKLLDEDGFVEVSLV